MDLLRPALQRYAWAQPGVAEEFLGIANDGAPIAEAWWGAHVNGSARLEDDTLLIDAVAADPTATLGDSVASRSGGQLPFLAKFLAVGQPLSVQVHPDLDQARRGFAEENAAGVPLGARERVFPDANHKPELVVAATPMRILAGFRPLADTAADLRSVGTARAMELAAILDDSADAARYVAAVLAAPVDDDTSRALAEASGASPSITQAAEALTYYPRDAGALVALALNVVELGPGESCFVPARVVHAYVWGQGVEVQATSDNVVRAGLTSKHIDTDLLVRMALFDPTRPVVTRAPDVRGIVRHASLCATSKSAR